MLSFVAFNLTYLETWSYFHSLSISCVLSSVYLRARSGIVSSLVSSTTSPGLTPNCLYLIVD